jgi:hypothetical protein
MFTDPPQVTLQLGNKLNPDTIKENDDVYFECNIRANPKKYKITWLHNVSIKFFVVLKSLLVALQVQNTFFFCRKTSVNNGHKFSYSRYEILRQHVLQNGVLSAIKASSMNGL